ncbi:hypothetical protein [Stenotrophomonas sp.]|uniref:hypothetical protein n=1 Tax=Stenotrophomonas sp. TaxID=69392 RepID=UPI0028A6B7C7|nr:hypothetical protein [Stenotrophomonas sp.]
MLFLMLWLAASWLWSSYWTAVPGQGAVAADGSFNLPLDIRPQEHWALNLDLHRGSLSDAQFAHRTMLWKRGTPDIGVITLHWRLLANNGQQVAAGSDLFHRIDSWSADTVSCSQPLPPIAPGRYRLVGQLDVVPASVAGMDMAVAVRAANGKAWKSWQIDLAWWMALLNLLFVLPVSILLLLILLANTLWRRRRRPH